MSDTSPHGSSLPPRQQLLAEVLAGDRAIDDPAVAVARTDVGFAAMLDELLAVQAQLERAAVAEVGALGEAPAPVDDAVAALARAQLRRRAQPHSFRWLGLVLAAALLVVTVFTLWRPGPGGPEPTLGGAQALRCSPDYAEIAWDAQPGRWQFEVRVHEDGRLLERSPPTRATTWRPDNRASFGPEVTIELWLIGTEVGDERRVATLRVGRDGVPR
jgi:hypothetical protein